MSWSSGLRTKNNIRAGLACVFTTSEFPVDTDSIILDICKNDLNITDMKMEDICRSHVIGKPKNGKSHAIVRFLSYRVRDKAYNSKKVSR